MAATFDQRTFQDNLQRLEALLQKVERFSDPAAQAHTRELVQAVLDLHGAGLERFLDQVADAGEAGQAILDACAEDEVVSGMLLLHGLHPLDLETRIRQALESVRPALRSHGGNVELLDVGDGSVRLRLEGNCHGCPSSAQTMRQTIEEAIYARAPEVTTIEVEGVTESYAAELQDGARIALPLL